MDTYILIALIACLAILIIAIVSLLMVYEHQKSFQSSSFFWTIMIGLILIALISTIGAVYSAYQYTQCGSIYCKKSSDYDDDYDDDYNSRSRVDSIQKPSASFIGTG
jgi:Na+/H+-translocating membrane pyrophosphatase